MFQLLGDANIKLSKGKTKIGRRGGGLRYKVSAFLPQEEKWITSLLNKTTKGGDTILDLHPKEERWNTTLLNKTTRMLWNLFFRSNSNFYIIITYLNPTYTNHFNYEMAQQI